MKKKAKIFSPDDILTRVSQALSRDMQVSTQVQIDSYDPLLYLRNRVVREFDKKFVSPLNQDESRSLDAYLKFFTINEHMQGVEQKMVFPSLDIERPQSADDKMARVLKRARLLMRFVLSPLSEDEWFLACKHGTGTSIGVPYKDTSLEAKSSLPITATERVIPLLNQYLSFDNQLKDAIMSYNSETPIGEWYRIVEGSRATTVPKTRSIDRMIAIEPTANMFFQQGLMSCMYTRMKNVGLDLRSLPTQHRIRARLSSITSREATIDWSSASDCVSRELLRWLLPPEWFARCDMVRSPSMYIYDGWIDLKMFSTMGNAVTFPLETLVFWTLGHAVRLDEGTTLSSYPEWEDLNSVSVFGDDCIIESNLAQSFIEACEYVGFIVNREKSFFGSEGFRESCGGDYLHGYDVRPFHLKGPTSVKWSSLEPWLYIIANRLLPKYISVFGTRDYIYEREFFQVFVSLFAENSLQMKIVPGDFPDDAGFKIGNDLQRFIDCYAPQLQRIKVNQHGCYTFNYCRFVYWQQEKVFGSLRFWMWQKNAVSRPISVPRLSHLSGVDANGDSDPFWYRTRVKGGYVVAKGRSAHWTVQVRKYQP